MARHSTYRPQRTQPRPRRTFPYSPRPLSNLPGMRGSMGGRGVQPESPVKEKRILDVNLPQSNLPPRGASIVGPMPSADENGHWSISYDMTNPNLPPRALARWISDSSTSPIDNLPLGQSIPTPSPKMGQTRVHDYTQQDQGYTINPNYQPTGQPQYTPPQELIDQGGYTPPPPEGFQSARTMRNRPQAQAPGLFPGQSEPGGVSHLESRPSMLPGMYPPGQEQKMDEQYQEMMRMMQQGYVPSAGGGGGGYPPQDYSPYESYEGYEPPLYDQMFYEQEPQYYYEPEPMPYYNEELPMLAPQIETWNDDEEELMLDEYSD